MCFIKKRRLIVLFGISDIPQLLHHKKQIVSSNFEGASICSKKWNPQGVAIDFNITLLYFKVIIKLLFKVMLQIDCFWNNFNIINILRLFMAITLL